MVLVARKYRLQIVTKRMVPPTIGIQEPSRPIWVNPTQTDTREIRAM